MGLNRHRRGTGQTRPKGSAGWREQKELRQDDIVSNRPVPQFKWANGISRREWTVYQQAIVAMRNSGVPFMLGGGFALATFTGSWRDTKDIDFYIRPQDRRNVVRALSRAGFSDYYRRQAYDRKWIY